MIGRLKGIIADKQAPLVLVDVHGVGYDVEVSMSTFVDLPAVDAPVCLYIHTHAREDALLLYGFASDSERQFFRMLLKVSGIGTRMALAVLSAISASEFAYIIANNDFKTLTKIPGIGSKTAQRMILELGDKFARELKLLPAQQSQDHAAKAEAHAALVSLGYKAAEVDKMLQQTDATDTALLIRQALQALQK